MVVNADGSDLDVVSDIVRELNASATQLAQTDEPQRQRVLQH